jgi:hypothetical protein
MADRGGEAGFGLRFAPSALLSDVAGFIKMNGAGNDFVLVDNRAQSIS